VSGVRIGALVRRLDDGCALADGADTVLPLASVGKLLILGEVCRRLATGSLDPALRVPVTDADRRLGGTGLLAHLSPAEWTVTDLVTAMTAVSDNAATNALLRLVTLDAVQDLARYAGLRDTTVHDRIRAHRDADVPALFATGTARDLCTLMSAVATDSFGGPETSRLMRRCLELNTDRSLVADSIRHDPWAPGGVRVLCKTGIDDGVRAEAGIVLGPTTVVYAVLGRAEAGSDRAVVEELRRWGDVVERCVSGADGPVPAPDADGPDCAGGSGQRSVSS
jgi:beta-lactamase class A